MCANISSHIVTDSLCDNEDIHREIKNLFIHINSLVRKFSKCSFYGQMYIVTILLFIFVCYCTVAEIYSDVY